MFLVAVVCGLAIGFIVGAQPGTDAGMVDDN